MTMPDHDTADHPTQPSDVHERSGDTIWTVERIRALGLVTDIATAARIFGLSRAAAYDLAKRDQFPVTVLRFGTRYRIPVAAILQALHLPVDDEQPPDPLPPAAT
ncbi:helix-turn-helix domain-containing protein [Actinoplanes sp. NPDC049668]|uniref:helix-turn-helix domain-containing protein n=1 Tax=unclassified Actinoplanes TaxID=2626549 RepID=UPI0033A93430